MESFLNRYRNITILLLVIFGQLLLLAAQVKNAQDMTMIRVWTVTAVTPIARGLEFVRGGSLGFVQNYIRLRDAGEDNRRLKSELDKLKIENHFLRDELNTAERAKTLTAFQSHTPSRTVAARIIGAGAGSNSKVFFVDRGSSAGVQRGMAVITPDGIAGKVIAAYPTASEIMLVTDPDFAAGVISQKNLVRGTLKGQGYAMCKVDYVPPEQKVEVGEMFYTSGDDRIFPKGFPVGQVKVVRAATPFKEILVEPAALQHGLEEVLILLQGVHQEIPEAPPAAIAASPVYIAPPPPDTKPAEPANTPPPPPGTDADRLRSQYKAIGEAQNHKFGEGLPGSKPPDFNLKVPTGAAAAGGAAASKPPSPGAPVAAAPGAPQPGVPVVKPGTGTNPPASPARKPGAAPAAGLPSPGAAKPAANAATPRSTASGVAGSTGGASGTTRAPGAPPAKKTAPAQGATPGSAPPIRPESSTASGDAAARAARQAAGAAAQPAPAKKPARPAPAPDPLP